MVGKGRREREENVRECTHTEAKRQGERKPTIQTYRVRHAVKIGVGGGEVIGSQAAGLALVEGGQDSQRRHELQQRIKEGVKEVGVDAGWVAVLPGSQHACSNAQVVGAV